MNESLPEIYGALRREAEKGSFPHIKLSLEITNEYTETGSNEDKPFILKVIYGDRETGKG